MTPTPPSTLSRRVQGRARVFLRRLAHWRALVLRALRPVTPPLPADWFTDAEVGGYDDVFPADDPHRIDDATWRDLEAKALLRRIADGAGIHARQYLFHRLRRGATFERGTRPAWLGEDGDEQRVLADTERARLQMRRQDMEVTGLLFRDQRVVLPARLRHLRWAKLLWLVAPMLMIAGWGLVAVSLAGAYLFVWGAVEVHFHARLQLWKRQRDAVLGMLQAVVDIGDVARAHPHPVLADIGAAADDAQRLRVALDLDALEHQAMTSDYLNLLTLHEYTVAPVRMAALDDRLGTLRTLYAVLAECAGRLCLMEYLCRQRQVCWARESRPCDILLAGMRNPLLDDAQALSLELRGEGAFLSGQNGVGKSTFLRAVGLNLLTARAFGFCYAAQAAVPMLAVCSSMVHEDSTDIGDSLYMAEMRRAQALLRVAQRAHGAVFLVDEIFRGTNHVESVAAAAAVLNRLASAGLLMVSSHNVVLAPLLRARLAPWRIMRAEARRLTIEPGVLLEPNGIAMMARYGIPDAVRAEALRVHDWFAGHLVTPLTFPTLA